MNAPAVVPLAPDLTWALKSPRGPNTGRAYVYLARGHSQPRHPLLMCEGFPGSHSLSYLLAVMEQHGLMNRLRAAGYDVVLIGLDQGTDRIQHNAGVIEACLAQLRAYTDAPSVVAGMSMGGLVARYALTRLEHEGHAHGARALLTLDTPHRGAYTSLAAQWFAQNFARAHPQIAQLAALLDSPANQQLMSHWLHQGQVLESPLRREFLDELAALGGYPRRLQRWAIASGRGDGVRSFGPHQLALDWRAGETYGARLWTLAENASARVGEGVCDGQACASLEVFSRWSWESAPGGQGRYLETAAQCAALLGAQPVHAPPFLHLSCTVPTASALDLPLAPFEPVPLVGQIQGPFHDWCVQAHNHPHLYFSSSTADWLLHRLGLPVDDPGRCT